MSWIEQAFAGLPDPRTGNAKRHDLLEVLAIALTAAICGAETCSDFADFAVDRVDLFREFLRLANGVPSHDTFSRLFRLLDPTAFAACFGRFVEALGARGEGVIAIDGKTLRRSFDTAAQGNPLAVVTAFASASQMVIGQESCENARNIDPTLCRPTQLLKLGFPHLVGITCRAKSDPLSFANTVAFSIIYRGF